MLGQANNVIVGQAGVRSVLTDDEIVRLKVVVEKLSSRAVAIAQVLGTFDGINDTWAGRPIYSDEKAFFVVVQHSLLRDLAIMSASVLPPAAYSGRNDDVRVNALVDFLSRDANLDRLVAYRKGEPPRSEIDERTLRGEVKDFLNLEQDEELVGKLWNFRNKRIAHLTVAEIEPALIGETKTVARWAIRAATLASHIFGTEGADYESEETLAREAAQTVVERHLLDSEHRVAADPTDH